ncbi:MAG: hypothetical protein R2795_06655 [Saprospiraceae bacterium]
MATIRTSIAMSALSESMIKQLALGYLKSYYRLRPRAFNSTLLTGLDMRGANDIKQDGFLRFTGDDGSVFTATFEATSFQTRDEILYKPRKRYTVMDGMAFAGLFLPCVLAISHLSGWYPLVGEDFFYRLLLLLGCIPLWVGIYFLLFYRLPRYRYIYAVEQFLQYHADERWVVYGYDVFENLPDKYRRELIRQCTRFGIGLVEITPQRKPHLVMAAGKAQNFVPRQPFQKWVTLQQWQQKAMAVAQRPWQRVKDALSHALMPVRSQYFRWFNRTYYAQWFLMGMGLLASVFFIRIEYLKIPVRFVQEDFYKKQVLQASSGRRVETEYFIIDAPIAGFFDTTYQPWLQKVNEEQFAEIIQTDGSEHADSIALPTARIVVSAAGEEMVSYYNCERFNNIHRRFFLVADTLFTTLPDAKETMSRWNDVGVNATAVWPPCLGGTGRGFLIFLDDLLTDSLQAYQLRDTLQLKMDSTWRKLEVMEWLPITSQ